MAVSSAYSPDAAPAGQAGRDQHFAAPSVCVRAGQSCPKLAEAAAAGGAAGARCCWSLVLLSISHPSTAEVIAIPLSVKYD